MPTRTSRQRKRGGALRSPEDLIGYPVGAERKIPDWPTIVSYFQHLAEHSDRVQLEELGRTTDDNPLICVTISAPENLVRRDELRAINARLYDSRDTPSDELPALVADGRTVALLLCTQHSNELGAALMTLELGFELATRDDLNVRTILEQTITLIVPCANPDGHQLIVDWYQRWLNTPYEGQSMPWLYHRYVGHDNNRDWFMLTQRETRLIAALHNREHPQLVFDMHQMGRDGARMMVPPFIDPLDPNQDPIIQAAFADVGTSIASRLVAAGKAGVATHIIFDNYSPSLSYGNYHGSVDLLSEAASCKFATPVEIKEKELKSRAGFDPRLRSWNHPLPWKGGKWTLRDIVEYDKLAAYGFLEHAARDREGWLTRFATLMRRTVERDEPPFAFLFPPRQHDPGALEELLQTLTLGAVEIHRATAPFNADGVRYPAGTWIVYLRQPSGNFVKTLLEIQRYPELRLWPDGPPQPPYDIAGHTLPLQMGVTAIAVKQPFEAAAAPEEAPRLPPGGFHGRDEGHYAFAPTSNRAAIAINRLLESGQSLYRSREGIPDLNLPPGTIALNDLPRRQRAALRALITDLGIDLHGVEQSRSPDHFWQQDAPRIGLYQSWKPAIDEGWTRFILEQYGFRSTTLHDADVRNGELAERFDAIIVPHQSRNDLVTGNAERNEYDEECPPDYVGGLTELGLDALREFVEQGGTLVALDGACEAIGKGLWLPLSNALEGVDRQEFYCPGSLLRILVDSAHPLGWGLRREETAVFINSPAFDVTAGAGTIVARYPLSDPNLSGWILEPRRLMGKAALVEIPLARGRVVLVGFRCQFRAQARGTYKVLFNALFRSALRPVTT